MQELELDRDATLHLRTSLGTARVVLPRSVRTAVVADTGLGRVDLARPILADVGHLMSPAAALAFLAHPDAAPSLRDGEIVRLDDVRTLYGLASIVPSSLGSPVIMGAVMLAWIVLPLGLANWRFKP